MKHIKGYWENKKNVFEESKKYTSRTSFNKRSHQAYEAARKNNWLDEMPWLIVKNKNIYSEDVDNVYRYFFKNENAIYIGRTINIELRDYQHRTTSKDSVYKFSIEHNTEIPEIEIIESGLTINEGIEKEIYWEKYYIDNGFTMINKTKCGAIGNVGNSKWSKNKCIEESKKYSTLSEYMKFANTAYQRSLKKGWIYEMTWLTRNKKTDAKAPKGHWNVKENVVNEAKKYISRTEFKKKSQSAYNSAIKNKWINEMTWLDANNMKHPKGYWKNRENMMEEAKKYTTKEEFKKGNLTAFLAAYRYGYIDETLWLVKQKQHKKNYWNYKHIEEEAIKYNTKTEFFKNNQTAYRAALKLGIIDDFFMLNDYVE